MGVTLHRGQVRNDVRRDPEDSRFGSPSPSHIPITVSAHLFDNLIIGNDQKAGLFHRVMGPTYYCVSDAYGEPGGVVPVGFREVRQ